MRILVASLLLLPTIAIAQAYQYEQPATITGKVLIIKSLHPNPEFKGEKQPALALDKKIVVDGSEGKVETKLIQLIDSDQADYDALLKSNGKAITVDCKTLFRAMTGHHTTKVLCDVEAYKTVE